MNEFLKIDTYTEEEKIDLYLRASQAYADGEPIMTDYEFNELEKLIPLEIVERQVDGSLSDEANNERLSILPIDDIEKVVDFIMKFMHFLLFFSLKVDGINTKVVTGQNFSAQSRARNGANSIDYTEAMKAVIGQFTRASHMIVGESFIKFENLPTLRKIYPKTGFKRSTSSAISVLRRPDEYSEGLAFLEFLPFYIDGAYTSKVEMYERLESLGFNTPPHLTFDFRGMTREEVKDKVLEIIEQLSMNGIPADGIVCEINDLSYVETINGKYSDREIAIKVERYGKQIYNARVIRVNANPGKATFGIVADVEPFTVKGATYQKVNVFNLQYVLDYGIQEGSVIPVEVQANGMAILNTK